MNKSIHMGTALFIAVVVGAVAFIGGMKYQQRKSPRMMFQNRGMNGVFGNGNRQFQKGMMKAGVGGRPVVGEIIKSDGSSITVKMPDGSSKIVLISNTTLVGKQSEVSKDELKTGVTVGVMGQENADGSVTASNIQLNPVFKMVNGLSGTPISTQ